jgi:2-phosphoglycerate kinase
MRRAGVDIDVPPGIRRFPETHPANVVDTRIVSTLDHIRWIGGGTGAGKTTVTRRLAERFGLPVYSSDETIRVHAARLSAAAAPLLEDFRRMSMDERWVRRDPVTMYQTFPWFHAEGFDLLIEDLRSLPSNRITLVEGFRLLPHLVRPHLSALWPAAWLIPTPEFRRAAFAARDRAEAFWLRTTDPRRALANLLERDEMFADAVAADAARNGLSTLLVDGAHPVDDTVDALAAHFGLLQ